MTLASADTGAAGIARTTGWAAAVVRSRSRTSAMLVRTDLDMVPHAGSWKRSAGTGRHGCFRAAHGACGCSWDQRRGRETARASLRGGAGRASITVAKTGDEAAASTGTWRCSGAPGACECPCQGCGPGSWCRSLPCWTQRSSAASRRNGRPWASNGCATGATASAHPASTSASGAASLRRCAGVRRGGRMGPMCRSTGEQANRIQAKSTSCWRSYSLGWIRP